MDSYFIVIFGLFIVVAIVGKILAIIYGKHRIQVLAEYKGYTIVNISYQLFYFSWRKGSLYFKVDYKDEQGQSRNCVCRTSFFSEVEWNA